MMDSHFFETMLDNLTDGIYILDDKGNYVFVNSAYVQLLNMPKSTLLKYNVQDFLDTGQIDFSISDIVYREKKQVVMFQDVLDTQNFGRKTFRQLVISTPIFSDTGHISNILAVVRPIDKMNDQYYQASQKFVVPAFSKAIPPRMAQSAIPIAQSDAMRSVFNTAATVASVDSAILITGESGTGKEVVAQYIHDNGNRSQGPMVVINCASLPENLLEAELFGYEKGAFTGASQAGKKGLFEEAQDGTLFLDEINSMPMNLQGKVLRALETKTIQRIGGNRSKKVDFRIVAAANEDLGKMVHDKVFRADLYYRLNVIPIWIPPLRDRKEDILPLSLHFLNHYSQKYSKSKELSPQAIDTIMAYSWPGNVRELKNFIERSVVMSIGRTIEILNIESFSFPSSKNNLIPEQTASQHEYFPAVDAKHERLLDTGVSLDDYLEQCEREYLKYALQKYRSTYRAASILGMSQTAVMRRKKKYAL